MHQRFAMVVALAVVMAVPARAGVLQFGDANVQGNNVTVPVVIEGDVGTGVSTISFTLTYDPDILEPVKVTSGPAADAADKDVMFNLVEPGRCNVVMMGLNQNVLSGNEVANVVMRRVATDATSAELAVVDPTFSDPNATAIPSQGSTQTIDFTGGKPSNNNTPDDQQDSENPANPDTADPTVPTNNPTETPGIDSIDTIPGGISTDLDALGGAFPALPQGIPADAVPAAPGTLPTRAIGPMASATPGAPGANTQLPQGIRPDAMPAGTVPVQPGTVNAQPATPTGTPGTRLPVVTGVEQVAMGTPGAVMPGIPGSANSKNGPASSAVTPGPATAPQGGIGIRWIGIGVIVLALLGLFAVRRRLFS